MTQDWSVKFFIIIVFVMQMNKDIRVCPHAVSQLAN